MKINNKEKNFISAVVYVHNNEQEIESFLRSVNEKLNENFEKYEIICVNDYSTDKSVEKIKEVSKEISNTVISIINMSFYQGMEFSMNAGVDLSIGDFVYEFDNVYIDYDLECIMDVYRKSLEGFDIVSAESNSTKRLTSKVFYKIFNKNSSNMYQLHTETFRILSRRAINRVKAMNKTIPYRKAIYANCGLKLGNISYTAVKKINIKLEKEIYNSKKGLAIDSIILFTNISSKFTIVMALIMMLLTIITAIYTIVVFICRQPIAGWTTTMLLLSFAFLGIFSILAIMIKYLSIIIDLIFKKQKYLIESVEKLTK